MHTYFLYHTDLYVYIHIQHTHTTFINYALCVRIYSYSLYLYNTYNIMYTPTYVVNAWLFINFGSVAIYYKM